MNLETLTEKAVSHRNLFLILLGAVLFVSFIGLRDVWYPDEPDIAEVALAMYLSGDWILPRRMGEIWVDYTPMIYWAGTLSAHLFGDMNAFTLRLPNALAAILIILITAATAARWFDPRSGFWTGLSLATCLLFVYEANSYRPDVLFTAFIAGGMFLYADGTLDRPSLWLRVAAFASFGGAMLTKGILGLLLPGLILVLWHGVRKEWRRTLELAPLSLVSLAVFLPWVAGTAVAMGWNNVLHEFYAQNFARFQSGFRGHEQPFWYYLRNFWFDFMPWSWLAPAAAIWTFRSGLWKNPRVQLALLWFGTFFVFLSIAVTKRQLYMLPAFPAFALIIGPWLSTIGTIHPARTPKLRGWPGEKPIHVYALIIATIFVFLGLLLVAAAVLFNAFIDPEQLNSLDYEVATSLRLPSVLLGSVLFAAGAWIGLACRHRDTRNELHRIAISHVAIYIMILGIIMPTLTPAKTYAPQGKWIREYIGPEQTHIGMVYPGGGGVHKRGAFGFETGGAMVDLLESASQVEAFFNEHPGSLVLVEGNSVDLIFADDRDGWSKRVVRHLWVGKRQYVVVDDASRP